MTYDVIVLGGGAMGSSAAYWLTRNNNVLLLDQFSFGHDKGSTHGQSRIIRKSYHQDYYVNMMNAAYELWREWETTFQEAMIIQTGGLDFGEEGNPDLKQAEQTVEKVGIDHEILDASGIKNRFPAFNPSDDEYGIFQPEAGIVNPNQTLRGLNLHILKEDGQLVGNQKVQEIVTGDIITVKTQDNTYKTKKLVLTPGSWSNDLTSSFDLQLNLEIWKINYAYWQPKDHIFEHYKSPSFPIFIHWAENTNYGFPMNEKEGLVKIAPHMNGKIQKTKVQDEINDINLPLLNSVGQFISNKLLSIDNHPQSIETCYYTMTPDENFVIDFIPEHPNIVLATGFSGHGFKFTPLIGKIIADLIEHGETEWDISPFSIDRF